MKSTKQSFARTSRIYILLIYMYIHVYAYVHTYGHVYTHMSMSSVYVRELFQGIVLSLWVWRVQIHRVEGRLGTSVRANGSVWRLHFFLRVPLLFLFRPFN